MRWTCCCGARRRGPFEPLSWRTSDVSQPLEGTDLIAIIDSEGTLGLHFTPKRASTRLPSIAEEASTTKTTFPQCVFAPAKDSSHQSQFLCKSLFSSSYLQNSEPACQVQLLEAVLATFRKHQNCSLNSHLELHSYPAQYLAAVPSPPINQVSGSLIFSRLDQHLSRLCSSARWSPNWPPFQPRSSHGLGKHHSSIILDCVSTSSSTLWYAKRASCTTSSIQPKAFRRPGPSLSLRFHIIHQPQMRWGTSSVRISVEIFHFQFRP